MKSKKSAKINKWQAVELCGDMFVGTENFEGFAGLEILENYDDTFLNPEDKNPVSKLLLFHGKQKWSKCFYFRKSIFQTSYKAKFMMVAKERMMILTMMKTRMVMTRNPRKNKRRKKLQTIKKKHLLKIPLIHQIPQENMFS